MDSEKVEVSKKDLKKIMDDLAQIKEILSRKPDMEESELADWAKKELENARNLPEEEYASLEDLERERENDL